MTPDERAALVEKARTYLGLDMPTRNIAADINLIRAETLEEAARVADENLAWDTAADIRAMKEKPNGQD